MYGESQVSFLENSLQMGDALFYSLNLFSDGVFRLIANPIACLSFCFLHLCILPVYTFFFLIGNQRFIS